MFTIFYRTTTYNPNRSYFQNQDKYKHHINVKTIEEVKATVEQIKADGGREIHIYNNVGNRVSIEA
jgi:glycerophosphoryl diester phosphodiesterase